MRGRIWAESVEGQGSQFHLELPFKLASKAVISSAADLYIQPKAADKVLNVLVADDNQLNLRTTVLLLEKIGHHAKGADNGKKAVELW